MSTTRWRWVAALAAVAILVAGAAVQMVHVHDRTDQWALSVSGARAPYRVHFEQRDYEQGAQVRVPADAVQRGRTEGGGIVFKPAGDQEQLSVVIYVSDGERSWEYSLTGGP